MKILKHLGPVAALALLPVTTALATPPPQLGVVLAQMDKAALTFKSAEADFNKDQHHLRPFDEHETQTGSIYVERVGGAIQMGARVVPAGTKTYQTIEYKGGSLRRFQSGLNCVETYGAGDKTNTESFLTLGFGGSGKDLQKNWDIEDQGSEKMSDGKNTVTVEKLDLKGKDQGVRNNFSHVTLWIDPVRGVSLKQVFYTPGGDINTAIYTNIRMNQSIKKDPYAVKGGPCQK